MCASYPQIFCSPKFACSLTCEFISITDLSAYSRQYRLHVIITSGTNQQEILLAEKVWFSIGEINLQSMGKVTVIQSSPVASYMYV